MDRTTAKEARISPVLLGDVLWRRRDGPAFDHCRFEEVLEYRTLNGVALAMVAGEPMRVHYVVMSDGRWATRQVSVQVTHGSVARKLRLDRDDAGIWRKDGIEHPELAGLADVDLGVTPATNTLPIRRLALEVGEEVDGYRMSTPSGPRSSPATTSSSMERPLT